jgi:hypothetical protein
MKKKIDHVFTAKQLTGEFIVVRGGRRAYLWVAEPGGTVATLHGQETLRKLARAILREVPAPRKRPKP